MNGTVAVAVAALALVSACPPANEPSSERPATATASASRNAEAVGPVERVKRATTAHMGARFADVAEIHTSLIRGELADAQRAALVLAADRPDVMLEEWAPFLLALRGTAEDLGRARSIDEASQLAATLAKTCGDCHETQGAHLPLFTTARPPTTDDRAGRMQRHAWAFHRLWEGLVLPSDESWKLGVDAFVELPECEDDLSSEADRAAIQRAREVVAQSEQDARAAVSREQRARVYGAMLPTCAACHASGC